MKILVIGGMHGNERLGVDLVASLQANPVDDVHTLIANPDAVRANTRYIESDLNRSFGDQPDDTLERRRAKEITTSLKNYDIVLDFHNTQTPNNDCCFVGVEADQVVYDAATVLGFNNCIQATYDCINKYASNVISVEVSIGGQLDSATYWYDVIKKMSVNAVGNTDKTLNVYRYAKRVTWQEQKAHGFNNWRPFETLRNEDATALGIEYGAVPIFIGSRLTEYYATLLVPVDTKQLNLANNR